MVIGVHLYHVGRWIWSRVVRQGLGGNIGHITHLMLTPQKVTGGTRLSLCQWGNLDARTPTRSFSSGGRMPSISSSSETSSRPDGGAYGLAAALLYCLSSSVSDPPRHHEGEAKLSFLQRHFNAADRATTKRRVESLADPEFDGARMQRLQGGFLVSGSVSALISAWQGLRLRQHSHSHSLEMSRQQM